MTSCYERGALDPADAARCRRLLAAFAPALIGTMIMVFVARIFYAVAYFRAILGPSRRCRVRRRRSSVSRGVGCERPGPCFWGRRGDRRHLGLGLAGRQVGVSARASLESSRVYPAVGRALLVAAALAVVRSPPETTWSRWSSPFWELASSASPSSGSRTGRNWGESSGGCGAGPRPSDQPVPLRRSHRRGRPHPRGGPGGQVRAGPRNGRGTTPA